MNQPSKYQWKNMSEQERQDYNETVQAEQDRVKRYHGYRIYIEQDEFGWHVYTMDDYGSVLAEEYVDNVSEIEDAIEDVKEEIDLELDYENEQQ